MIYAFDTSLAQPARSTRLMYIGNSNDNQLSLGHKADSIAEDGGYDLSLDFQRQE